MQFYLTDIGKNPLLPKVLQARIELGGTKDSDAFDEMYRQIVKKQTVDEKQGQIVIGDANIHRVIKDLVKLDAEKKDSSLDFSTSIS